MNNQQLCIYKRFLDSMIHFLKSVEREWIFHSNIADRSNFFSPDTDYWALGIDQYQAPIR